MLLCIAASAWWFVYTYYSEFILQCLIILGGMCRPSHRMQSLGRFSVVEFKLYTIVSKSSDPIVDVAVKDLTKRIQETMKFAAKEEVFLGDNIQLSNLLRSVLGKKFDCRNVFVYMKVYDKLGSAEPRIILLSASEDTVSLPLWKSYSTYFNELDNYLVEATVSAFNEDKTKMVTYDAANVCFPVYLGNLYGEAQALLWIYLFENMSTIRDQPVGISLALNIKTFGETSVFLTKPNYWYSVKKAMK